jgi:hypothetical protein
MDKTYDIAFSFDTTGSMYPCIKEVKRNLSMLIKRLFEDIPNLRIAIIAHGDYCDENNPYLIDYIDLTNDQKALTKFVDDVKMTSGGDYPEAYEYVLFKTKSLQWESNNMRALVLIGDATPHTKEESKYHVDWREEATHLLNMNVNVYTIQCLDWGNKQATTFYKELANKTNGYHLKLNQFSHIKDILMAVCYKQVDDSQVCKYEDELKASSGITKNLQKIFDTMLNRKIEDLNEDIDDEDDVYDGYKPSTRTRTTTKKVSLYDSTDETIKPSNGAKFQVFNVEEDCSIKDFVINMGLTFKTGKGFYEFVKAETIADSKEIVLMSKATGELFEGGGARKLAKIDTGSTKKIKPSDIPEFRVFVQSTSANRKLVANAGFLYEVDGFGKA